MRYMRYIYFNFLFSLFYNYFVFVIQSNLDWEGSLVDNIGGVICEM